MKNILLQVRQILARVGDPLKKPATRDKIKPLGFQRVGLEVRQLGVTWFAYPIVPFGTRKCHFQHVLLYPEG
jgi:hypothetical protein